MTYLMNFVDSSFFSFVEIPSAWFKSWLPFKESKFDHNFSMGLLMGLMTIGREHGRHASLMVKENAYVGHKCGSQRTWMIMSKFCHYHMILMLWQVSTMMWLKLAKTSFKAWLQIQGVTISLFMGILFFIVCFN